MKKDFKIFNIGLNKKYYKNDFLPRHKIWAKKIFKKTKIDWNEKVTLDEKTSDWDTRTIYPTVQLDFINEFFKKGTPEYLSLEGIWKSQPFDNASLISGIVKKKNKYDVYLIQCNVKHSASTGSFFKDIFNNPGEVDYSIINGHKTGVLIPDKKNKKKFLFKGVTTVIDQQNENELWPVNYLYEQTYFFWGSNMIEVEKKGWENFFKLFPNAKFMNKIWPPEIEKLEPYKGERYKPKDETAEAQTPNEVGSIGSSQSEKLPSSVGTGFFVTNKGHIVTNFHVVNGVNTIKFLYNDDEMEAKLIAHDQVLDLALLKCKINNKNFIKFSNKSPQKAQDILVAGYPFGKALSDDLKITGGIINSLKGLANNTAMLQIDATILPGNSGGPIVDRLNGSLVGVSTMSLDKDKTKEAFGVQSENTNFGIKASQVRDFLEANKIKVSIKKNKFNLEDLESSTVFLICQ